MFRSIRWRITVSYTLLALIVMAALAIYLTGFVRQVYLATLEKQLAAEGRLIADALALPLAADGAAAVLDAQARHYAAVTNARVTLIALDGAVVGESHEDRTQMDNHLYRAEVRAALAQGQGAAIRYSHTTGYDMLYVAVPAQVGDEVVGVVRVALSLEDVQTSIARLHSAVLTATLLAAALAALLAFVVAEITARPVRRLTQMAGQMSGGDLDTRLLPTTRDEVGALAHAFNQMAERLQGTVDALRSERSRMVGVMEHMADGVLITDDKGCVQLVNPAALRLLGVDREKVVGHRFTEATHDYRLIGLWQQCHEQRREQIEMVELAHGPFLRAIVSPLRDAEEGTCLFVLQDLTEVRRAETARRDFVSNASHELRTPLAALRALVETLRDGALEDPPAARHFLERMDIEVDALTQMVEELLALSRIESGRAELEMRPHAVRDVIVPPVERLRPQAERARVTLTVELPPDLPPVRADLDHVRQVVTNLVHNSIKFTPAGGQVVVRAVVEKDAPPHLPIPASPCLIISVSDTGAGIAADDLPRIFERFFKADRARSGGGTGLGLAIARHIVRAHGGSIWAESVEERGSTFTFTLPLAKP